MHTHTHTLLYLGCLATSVWSKHDGVRSVGVEHRLHMQTKRRMMHPYHNSRSTTGLHVALFFLFKNEVGKFLLFIDQPIHFCSLAMAMEGLNDLTIKNSMVSPKLSPTHPQQGETHASSSALQSNPPSIQNPNQCKR